MSTATSTTKPLPAPKKAVDLETVTTQLRQLGMEHAAAAVGPLITDAMKEETGLCPFLERVLAAEIERREERRIATALRLSGIPTGPTLQNFDFAFQPSVERSRIDALGTMAWVREHASLLIIGPPGVGKTHLATGFGQRAIEVGLSVAWFRVEELLHAMRKDAALPPAQLRRRKYMKPALLIVDEIGFEPFSREDANLFFRLISYRYGRGAICLTSNKAIPDWPEMFAGDEAIATAVLDRLLHRSHVLTITGRSYRLRDLEDRLRP